MTVTADALDLLAGDPPRYPHIPGDFRRHPETGAPYVNHPTETKRDGTPRRVMYGRPSSFGGALDNPYNLLRWKERQLVAGIARQEQAGGVVGVGDEPVDLSPIIQIQQVDPAGVDLGIPDSLQRQIVLQWHAFRQRLGLTALAVEQTVVNDRWRLAGTLDRLDVADHDILTAYGVLEAGVPFVGDIKTGSLTIGNDGQPSYWVRYGVQIAAYVDGVPYDTETDERGEW